MVLVGQTGEGEGDSGEEKAADTSKEKIAAGTALDLGGLSSCDEEDDNGRGKIEKVDGAEVQKSASRLEELSSIHEEKERGIRRKSSERLKSRRLKKFKAKENSDSEGEDAEEHELQDPFEPGYENAELPEYFMPPEDLSMLGITSTESLSRQEVKHLGPWAYLVVGNVKKKSTWYFPVRQSDGKINLGLLHTAREELRSGKRMAGYERKFSLREDAQRQFFRLCEIAWPGLPEIPLAPCYTSKTLIDMGNKYFLCDKTDLQEETYHILQSLGIISEEDRRREEQREAEALKRQEEEERVRELEERKLEEKRAKEAKILLEQLRLKRQQSLQKKAEQNPIDILEVHRKTEKKRKKKKSKKRKESERKNDEERKKRKKAASEKKTKQEKLDPNKARHEHRNALRREASRRLAFKQAVRAGFETLEEFHGVSQRKAELAASVMSVSEEEEDTREQIEVNLAPFRDGDMLPEDSQRTEVLDDDEEEEHADVESNNEEDHHQNDEERKMEPGNAPKRFENEATKILHEFNLMKDKGKSELDSDAKGISMQVDDSENEEREEKQQQEVEKKKKLSPEERAAAYRKILERENKNLQEKQRDKDFVEAEASEEEVEDGIGDYGNSTSAARKKRSHSEERDFRMDRAANEITAADLEDIVDDISDDEGKDGGDVDLMHRDAMRKKDDEELERLEADLREHRLMEATSRRQKGKHRVDQALGEASDAEDTDEEDEMAKEERFRSIEVQRHERAVQGEGEGETLAEVEKEKAEFEDFIQQSRLERQSLKQQRQLKATMNGRSTEAIFCTMDPIEESHYKNILGCVRRTSSLPNTAMNPKDSGVSLQKTSSTSSTSSVSIFGGRTSTRKLPSFREICDIDGGTNARSSAGGAAMTTVNRQFVFTTASTTTGGDNTSDSKAQRLRSGSKISRKKESQRFQTGFGMLSTLFQQ